LTDIKNNISLLTGSEITDVTNAITAAKASV
jgi:hypothetical protein